MRILSVRHITTYRYKQPVGFGEHRMMLCPREDHDQRLLEVELEITPKPTFLRRSRDVFGNPIASAHFSGRAKTLRFESRFRLEHSSTEFVDADIEGFARGTPPSTLLRANVCAWCPGLTIFKSLSCKSIAQSTASIMI